MKKLKKCLKIIENIELLLGVTYRITMYSDKSIDLMSNSKLIGNFNDSERLYNYLELLAIQIADIYLTDKRG